MESGLTLSCFVYGCSARTDGVRVDVIVVCPWLLCENGWRLDGHYHVWPTNDEGACDFEAAGVREEPV